MNIGGGEAADQLVRMMLTGTEAAVRLSGSALKNMLAISLALAKNHKRISGKVNLGKMLRETRDLRQFPMTPEQYHQFQKLAKRQMLLYSSIHDRDGHGKIIDVILPVTELDRANQIFERMLYQEPSRHPEQQGPQEAEKAAATRQKQPRREERQEGAQSRQEGPVTQQQAQRPKKDFRSERDSRDTRTSSSTLRESGSTGMMPERPSVLERLKGYRAQLDRKSAPARQKTKNQHKTR
ncbi:MAG: PcfB family protein [Oscillibacter sp.]|uniref:DUF3801 domain-containing protein n=1 Tax=Oscillibacter sp. TaxID=1945593 RepID=UPI001D56A5CB|nr:DUF3801 domain-containing protein [Oscillibacter sp.]MBS6292643.1 PcfB family protein [Oscillibacter sp.]